MICMVLIVKGCYAAEGCTEARRQQNRVLQRETELKNLPGNKLDKVVVQRDPCPGIKDGGVGVTDEVRGHHLEHEPTTP